MASQISFDVTDAERAAIKKIVSRAISLKATKDRMSATMDLVACNANGTPIDFERLLVADDFNFLHDFCGVARHLDRATGKLSGSFLPRFARRRAA
jgi:hypothetical protein